MGRRQNSFGYDKRKGLTGVTKGMKPKHTIKDSVFTNLFGEMKYLLQLYQSLHPEDIGVKESDFECITLHNIFSDGIYNDLGFVKGDKLMILVEAQTTWSANIIIRALEYLVNSYRRYFTEHEVSLHERKKVELPKPELYVIYTGRRKMRPEEICLSREFFAGEKTALEVTVKMIYDGKEGDIISQYVSFTKVFDEQVKKFGKTRKAIQETIRVCRDADVLREYLAHKESEVVDIMMQLYDDEEIARLHDITLARRVAICTTVGVCKDFNMTFSDTVKKIASKFEISHEQAEKEVEEYWEGREPQVGFWIEDDE